MAQWHTGLARWAPLNILLLRSVSMTHPQISNIIYVSLLSLYVVLYETVVSYIQLLIPSLLSFLPPCRTFTVLKKKLCQKKKNSAAVITLKTIARFLWHFQKARLIITSLIRITKQMHK